MVTMDDLACAYVQAHIQTQKSMMGEFGVPAPDQAEHDAFWNGYEQGIKSLGDAAFGDQWPAWMAAITAARTATDPTHHTRWEAYRQRQGWTD